MDMGTGIKNLGEKIVSNPKSPSKINIFLSHYHWDHVMGFLSFAPLFDDKYTINIYGNNQNTPIEKLTEILFKSDFWPVDQAMLSAKLNFHTINNNTIILDVATGTGDVGFEIRKKY